MDSIHKRFNQNMQDCKFMLLSLAPAFNDTLFADLNVELLITQLQSCRTNGQYTPEEYKLEKIKRWEEIKLQCIPYLTIL